MLFKLIAFFSFIFLLAILLAHSVLAKKKTNLTKKDAVELFKFLGLLFWCDKLTYIFLLLSAVVLAGTGFYASLLTGEEMEGFLLMTHVGAGGAFAVLLVLFAVLRGDKNRVKGFDENGCECGEKSKFFFWLVILSGAIATLTVMFSMTPLFGTYGQHFLYEAHRYSGLVAVLATILYVYFRRWEALKRV